MREPASKIVVLGIDAASPDLLRQWAAEGVLPNLRALIERGLVGTTRSVEGFYVGSTWPSFYTGLTPAGHGCHYLAQLELGTYRFYRVADRGVTRAEPFWTRLSRAGRRVAVLDVPLTSLDVSINGIQTVEWGGHDAVYGFCAAPAGLAATIRSRVGVHPFAGPCDAIARTADGYERFVRALSEGARLKGELTRHFLQQGDWDFFIQVFTESHCAGHQCWHLHAADHPAHDPAIVARTGDPLRRVYESIDRAIGGVLHDAGDALVIVLAAHGMSHWHGANFLLQEILCRLGVARPLDGASGPAASALERARRFWRRLPRGFRSRVARLRTRSGTSGLPGIRVDPGASLCFPQNNGQPVSGVRFNLKGREPQGVLTPETAEDLAGELTRNLLDIIDERTGGRLVRRVLRTRDLGQGPFLDALPDLLVEWADDRAIGTEQLAAGAGALVRARSAKIGLIEGVNAFGRTGEHRPEGLFIAAGPGVRAGAMNHPISILDFAPTFAARLDVEYPLADGRPVSELLR